MAWYEIVSGPHLSQGDIIPDCELLNVVAATDLHDGGVSEEAMASGVPVTTEILYSSVVVLTQSCDLENSNIENVVLCPVVSVSEFVVADPNLRKSAGDTAKKMGCTLPVEADSDFEARMSQIVQQSSRICGTLKDIAKGRRPGYVLLHPYSETPALSQSIVVFRHLYVQPRAVLEAQADRVGPRHRLCSPYREHLAQSFANYFSRIGLPVAALSPEFSR